MTVHAARLVLITSDHRRHRWLARHLAEHATLLGVIAESKPPASAGLGAADMDVERYFFARDEAEERWFGSHGVPESCRRFSVPWGGSNSAQVYDFVNALAPDAVVLFGSSIIKDPLLGRYCGRIINMHLGLSPYYRGSATNFWPLVDNLPECVGVTIHHATLAVDGGAILSQARPVPALTDTSHDLGCKAIITGAEALVRLAPLASERALPVGITQLPGGRLCRRDDFTPDAVRRLGANLRAGMMPAYIAHKRDRDARFPIYEGGAEHS